MELFLREVYSEDKDALKAISEKSYTIDCTHQGYIKGIVLPEVYDTVIAPGWNIIFSILNNSSEELPENLTTYETKVRYQLDCFRKSVHGDTSDFMWSISSNEPTTFEYDYDKRGDLPVIEEKKVIVCSSASQMTKPKDEFKGKIKRPQHDVVTSILIQVHSHYLLNLIRSTIRYTTKSLDDYAGGYFYYPYMDLHRHREEIEKYKTGNCENRSKHSDAYNEQCDKHIDVLLQYLDSVPLIRDTQIKLLQNKPQSMVTFAGVALLLKPLTDVYVHENGKLNAYVVDKLTGGIQYPAETTATASIGTYRIRIWNLQFDGKRIYRKSHWVHIPYFDGEREITTLLVHPVEYSDRLDGSRSQTHLINRGKKYFSYCKRPTFLEYSGLGLGEGWKSVSFSQIACIFA